MAPTNEELEAERAELKQELEDERVLRGVRAHFLKEYCVIKDIKTEDAVWRKILEESMSENEKNPRQKNVHDEFIRQHDSLSFAVSYSLAKLLSNNLVNFSELLELFQGYFVFDCRIMAEVLEDLSAAKVRYVPNGSYVETLLYSRSFLALQAHRVAHELWFLDSKTLALFIQKRVSEVFAVNILPEEIIERSMLRNNGFFVGETDTGKNVTVYHGKVHVCHNKSLAKESPNHPANLVRERLKVKDGYFHQGFYRDEEATASGCQPHGAEISQDGGIQLVQSDHGSANSTQVASPSWKYKTSAPPANIRGGNGKPLCYVNDRASSSQSRPTNRSYQLNLSTSANKFLPTGGELIQPADRGSTNSTQVSSPLSITVYAADNTGRASGSSGNIQDGIRQAQHHTNGGAASSQVRPTNGRNEKKLSSLLKIFIPVAFALLLATSLLQYSANSTSLSAHARILLILGEVFGFNGLLLCLGGYFTPPSSSSAAQWLTIVGCVAILCGYISIMCSQLF